MINEKMFTPEQIAEMFQVTGQTVRNWLSRGELKGMKLGTRAWRVKESDLEAFIKQQEQNTQKEIKG